MIKTIMKILTKGKIMIIRMMMISIAVVIITIVLIVVMIGIAERMITEER